MMNFEQYKKKFYTQPQPEQRYDFLGIFGITLFYEDYPQAVEYYTAVLGPPGYVEGVGTRGWKIGQGWLTILKGNNGNPQNVEITFEVRTIHEAEQLQQAFINAGGQGSPPSDELMYTPVRFCPVVDPFGTNILVFCRLTGCE